MSNTTEGKPLEPNEVVPEEFEDDGLYSGAEDNGLGLSDEDEDEQGLPTEADRENQAGTEQLDPNKFKRE